MIDIDIVHSDGGMADAQFAPAGRRNIDVDEFHYFRATRRIEPHGPDHLSLRCCVSAFLRSPNEMTSAQDIG